MRYTTSRWREVSRGRSLDFASSFDLCVRVVKAFAEFPRRVHACAALRPERTRGFAKSGPSKHGHRSLVPLRIFLEKPSLPSLIDRIRESALGASAPLRCDCRLRFGGLHDLEIFALW